VLGALKSIRSCLEKVESENFSVKEAEESRLALKQAEENHNRALERIKRRFWRTHV